MKNLLLILVALFVCQMASAQRYQPIKKNTNLKYRPNIPIKVNPYLIKPDLTVLSNINLVTQNGKRYLYAKVKNIGGVRANGNRLQLRYSWRVDHESFTNITKTRNYNIPPLNPGQHYQLCVLIPDSEIHSNEGYGSSHASFRFHADQPNGINEIKENNNIGYISVPILRD